MVYWRAGFMLCFHRRYPPFSDLENCIQLCYCKILVWFPSLCQSYWTKPLDSYKMLCFVPLQCIPTQELSYQVRPKVILAQIQCLNCSPGANKSTEKACLPQQIIFPSWHLQHKDFLEVICEALASQTPCTRIATFNCMESVSLDILQFLH